MYFGLASEGLAVAAHDPSLHWVDDCPLQLGEMARPW